MNKHTYHVGERIKFRMKDGFFYRGEILEVGESFIRIRDVKLGPMNIHVDRIATSIEMIGDGGNKNVAKNTNPSN